LRLHRHVEPLLFGYTREFSGRLRLLFCRVSVVFGSPGLTLFAKRLLNGDARADEGRGG
jgi:hypothetical protein